MTKPIRVLILQSNLSEVESIQKELLSAGIPAVFTHLQHQKDYETELNRLLPDLVITDHELEDFTGLKALEILNKKNSRIPLIFVSPNTHPKTVLDTLEAGARDYIFKEDIKKLPLIVFKVLRETEKQKELDCAEKELKKSEIYFKTLVESATDVVTILDEEGVIEYQSPSTQKVLGYLPDELFGKSFLQFVNPTDTESTIAFIQEILENKNKEVSSTAEFRFLKKNGQWLRLEAIGKTMHEENGKSKIVLNSRDITDRHDTEDALKENTLRILKIQAELQKAQQKIIEQERLGALGQMASGIAHDFSNTLMPVLGFCELLLKHPENLEDHKKVTEYLTLMNMAALDAKNIVSRLKDFYRARKSDEVFDAIDLKKLIEQVISLTQPRWKDQALLSGRTIEIKLDIENTQIWGNESSLREALANLILNSVDAMPHGGSLSFISKVEGDYALLQISDTGTGMTDEVRRHCFDPFFSTKGSKGTGLGLAMVYGIVRRHEGVIDIKSQIGKGTTFIMRLPLKGSVADKKFYLETKNTILNRHLHALVIDDEPMVHEIVREYLKGDGHTSDTASNGIEGLDKCDRGHYDLVITDWAMPQMNGAEFSYEMKKKYPQTPIIMLTGFGELVRVKEERPQGVDILLSKPVTVDELRQALVRVFPNG